MDTRFTHIFSHRIGKIGTRICDLLLFASVSVFQTRYHFKYKILTLKCNCELLNLVLQSNLVKHEPLQNTRPAKTGS
jgi:hypothetical protein